MNNLDTGSSKSIEVFPRALKSFTLCLQALNASFSWRRLLLVMLRSAVRGAASTSLSVFIYKQPGLVRRYWSRGGPYCLPKSNYFIAANQTLTGQWLLSGSPLLRPALPLPLFSSRRKAVVTSSKPSRSFVLFSKMDSPQSSAGDSQTLPNDPYQPNCPRVIVVGAGIAGLVAAHKLQTTGRFDVVVLEGSDRVGGRVYTSTFRGKKVELGAQWIHGIKGSPVYALAKEEGLMESEDALGESEGEESDDEEEFDFDELLADISVTRTETGGVIDKALRREVGRVFRRLHKATETKGTFQPGGVESVGEYLDKHFEEWLNEEQGEGASVQKGGVKKEGQAEGGGEAGRGLTQAPKRGLGPEVAVAAVSRSGAPADTGPVQGGNASGETPGELRALKGAVFEMRKKLECNITGSADLTLLSLEAFPDYSEFPGPQLQIPRGYSGVAEALSRKLLPGTVHFNQRVKCIKWGLGGAVRDDVSSLEASDVSSKGGAKAGGGAEASERSASAGARSEEERVRSEGLRDPVRVDCESGDQFAADHVIVTVSLGVLKERAAASRPCDAFSNQPSEAGEAPGLGAVNQTPNAGTPRTTDRGFEPSTGEESESARGTALFDPPLPEEKQAAIRRMGFGVVDKVFVDFEKQPLPKGCGSLELAWLLEAPGKI